MSVGVILVCHSRRLAEGLAEMLEPLHRGTVPVRVAAGTADGGIGTDALSIQSAIYSLAAIDGAVILMDLGSAMLATEAALELVSERAREFVTVADAPLVEGAVAAVVEASVGASLEGVRMAAESARGVVKFP